MKPYKKNPLLQISLGVPVGSAIYDLLKFGYDGIDWYRVIFIGVFTFVVLFTRELFLGKKIP